MTAQQPTLLNKVRETLRVKHYSPKTEESYIHWIRQFIRFHKMRHPREMGNMEVESFLTHLAVEQKVSASTQNQALSALLFLYREVLKQNLTVNFETSGAQRSKTVPTVLTKEEVNAVLGKMSGMCGLMARILYGSGLRLNECVQLRVKDIDFGQRQILVHDGKGEKDRVTMLLESLIAPLQAHLEWRKRLHEEDLKRGFGSVYLPYALERKYPNAPKEWLWQFAFPSAQLAKDDKTGITRR